MGTIRVGLSGWDYPDWRGSFYPPDLARSEWLAYVADRFDTMEINRTFYRLPTPRVLARWAAEVPAGFVFAVKGSRFITHNKKLVGVETALANFMASGPLDLGGRLGPFLWQLPANLHFDRERVERFLSILPGDMEAAQALARRHDERVSEPSLGPGGSHRLRHVLEVRHHSYLCGEMVTVARETGVALAFSHGTAWPYTEEVTAGFVYLRLHGPRELYASAYGDSLGEWTKRIEAWHRGGEPPDAERIGDRVPPRRKERDVYVYFDNDSGGHAPGDAAELRRLLDL